MVYGPFSECFRHLFKTSPILMQLGFLQRRKLHYREADENQSIREMLLLPALCREVKREANKRVVMMFAHHDICIGGVVVEEVEVEGWRTGRDRGEERKAPGERYQLAGTAVSQERRHREPPVMSPLSPLSQHLQQDSE